MTRLGRISSVTSISLILCACGNGAQTDATRPAAVDEVPIASNAPEVKFTPGDSAVAAGKPQSPIKISYRIIGQPIVGQPVAIDLQFESAVESQSFDVSYRVNDSTALQFPESQPTRVAMAASRAEGRRGMAAQQISVIPMREGRLYLNVAAQIETEGGSFSSVTAVPIQVGQAPREAVENGVVKTDANGELIRTLPAKED